MSLSWTMIMGVIFALVLGCGSTDNPVGENTQKPSSEPPTHIVSPILGDWRLMDIIWFEEGMVTNQIDGAGWIYGANPNVLTLAPDGTFNLTQRYPIQEEHLEILEWKGWGHIQEVLVIFRGKYHVGENKLRLNLIVTRVEPKEEAPEIGQEYENPEFLYDVWYKDAETLDYSLTDNGNQLELSREQGEHMVKFIHIRTKTEKNTS